MPKAFKRRTGFEPQIGSNDIGNSDWTDAAVGVGDDVGIVVVIAAIDRSDVL